MKTSYILFAIFITAAILFAWSFAFWSVVEPERLAYQAGTISPELSETVSGLEHGQYHVQTNNSTEVWLDVASSQVDGLGASAKALGLCLLSAVFGAFLILAGGLQRVHPVQRFTVLMLAGLIVSCNSLLPVIFGNRTSLGIVWIHIAYELVFWLILAVSLSLQIAVKKRNIFRDK